MLSPIFEDNHLLVVDKPSGLLVQPTKEESDSLLTRLRQKYTFLEPIHRIDKPVSGVVVFAKSSKALARLMAAVREKRCRKHYVALVAKKPPADKGRLEHTLAHGHHRALLSEEGKESALTYEVLGRKGAYYLLGIDLETGRYHQIRMQLAAIGSPIVGDQKYGSREPYHEKAIALHHEEMQLPHPVSGEMMTFTAPWRLN
jgi:23S rRNA pseudouridine1911/1915/1917 synthase